ncbi:restriction endonuclease [Nocardia wallacei]|uniref:restriction endonuclease n=1 Tax=Nocardia wallacei TaxID=480035 RepID=UPI0024567412|nr:restriction endonuclease [Nocardia wallacei]
MRGYVLEELLARLLQDNGYRLLVSADQDPEALQDSGRGLLVRGRGAKHQVDVLGELDLPLPFSLPLRLFVEAKHREKRTGIEQVRNAYGTIRDVNEHYGTPTPGSYRIPMKRYQYQYALFSASGFTQPAQEYALAQQISLIDLSNPGFSTLLAAADDIATRIVDLATQTDLVSLPLNQIRHALRHALGTWPANVDDEQFPDLADHIRELRGLVGEMTFPSPVFGLAVADDRARAGLAAARQSDQTRDEYYEYEYNESTPTRELPTNQLAALVAGLGGITLDNLVLGFPSAPFVLVLLVDHPEAFAEYIGNPRDSDIRVYIEYPRDHHNNRPLSRDWEIVPVDTDAGFRLSFTLPAILADWMLSGEVPTWSLREAKTTLLSSISVMHNSRVVRLLYQPHPRGNSDR